MTEPTPPTSRDKAAALPYLVTAWIGRALIVGAVAFGLWAAIRFGPLAGLAAGGLGAWAARGAIAPMPPDMRDKFR